MQYLNSTRVLEALSRKVIVPLLIFLALLSSAGPASAGNIYYLATNGSDLGSGTSSAPWQTFSRAWNTMAPGDTLIVKNGRYYQAINPTISGTAGNPITIRAESDGGAVLDGQGSRSGINIFSQSSMVVQYITIEGFRVENSGERPAVQVASADGTPLNAQSNNIIIRRTGARGDAMRSNNPVWGIARARDSLLEDVWGWRYGRYVINVYGCTRVTVRRGVFRWDGWGQGAEKPGDPKFNMGVYDTHDSLFENVLLLDAASDPLGGDKGGLYVPGNSNGATAPYGDSDNNTFKGLISLNNIGVGIGVEGGTGGTNDNNRFVDLVSWGNSSVGGTVPRKASGTSFDHVTIGSNGRGFYFGHDYDAVSGTTLRNSLVYANTSDGINGPANTSYNNVYANGTNYNGGASAGASTISQDPLLDFIVRIEAGSPGKGTAADGGDRGANAVKRYINGTLTSEDLWPWPYQDRIHADLCENTSRGLCDPSWSSLTDYVWGQLGNPPPPPPPIDNSPPTVPSNPTLGEPTATALIFSWTASTDDVGVVKYRVDVSAEPSFSSYVPGYESKDVGNVIQTVISGLAPETTYYARVRAYDAAGNGSLDSATASGTTALGAPCLTVTAAQWQNQSFDPQTGRFTAEVDVTPSGFNVDAAVSVSSGPQTTWDGLAATVLFFTDGLIKARNGTAYTGTVAYTGGTAYHVRLVIDLASHTYSAYVTPAGGIEQVIGTNLAFRNGQESVTTLDHWTISSDAGSLQACDFQITPAPACVTATYPSPQWQSQAFMAAQTGTFMAEAVVTPSASNVDAAVSVSNGPQPSWDSLATTVLFYTDGYIKARNGGAYTTGTVQYSGGTTYHVRMIIDLASHTYSAYVIPAGGTEQVIGTNLAFRATQSSVTSLDNWTLSADAGSLTACGLTISASPPPPPPQSQVFQQGLNGYTGVRDTWINFYDPNLNFNGENKLNVQGHEDIKALVRFDLSSIPVGATITSATLSLYNYAHSNSANGGTLSVYPPVALQKSISTREPR